MTTMVLDNFLDEKYSRYFSRYYQDNMVKFLPSSLEFPDNLDDYDHIIISGSEDSVLNDKEYIYKEMELIRECVDKGIPTLGICFGHQMIARALLGLDGVRRRESPEIGWKKVTVHKSSPLFEGLENEFFIFNSHFDEVHNLTDEFEILASSEMCDAQVFQVVGKPVWGIQFHPEIDIESGKKFIGDLKQIFPDLDFDFNRAINEVNDSGISKKLFENFYGI
jgi:GMP synthase-like glutamine amidotransferase